MLNMQNVKDIGITEGDVRTIHDKDSRLIWGRVAYDTKYAGDTFQQTYSGKNLIDITDGTYTTSGITVVVKNNYVTIASNENTSSNTYVGLNLSSPLVLPAGTYTLSKTNGVRYPYIQLRSGATTLINTTYSDQTVTKTFSESVTIDGIYCYFGSSKSTEPFYIQIESGSSASPFEPYVGGIPAPNPDYPQPIQVVTGEQTVTVTGKNLWSPTPYKTGNTINASGVEVVTVNGSIWELKNVSANTTFTISLKDSYVYPGNLRVHAYTSTGSWIEQVGVKSISANTSGSLTFTTPANTAFLRWGFWSDVSDAQLELGSTPTPYEPYQSQTYPVSLGSLELCKIGDYQDYIYKSGDDWYVHKEYGERTVDTSAITLRSSYSNIDYAVIAKPSDSVFYGNYQEMQYPLLYTHAEHSSPSGNFNNASYVGKIFMSGQSNNYWVGFTKNTSLDSIKSILNGATLYYPLVAPTDTKITDATLVGQLNAVHEWLTRYGYNSTVSGNLPIIINQTNL